MSDLPLLTDFGIKQLSYYQMRARKFITFPHPCIGYLLHGSAEFWLDGQNYSARAGDLIYIAAETEYYSLWIGDPQVTWYSISFAFTDPMAFSDFRFQILHDYPGELLHTIFQQQQQDPLRAMASFYSLLAQLYGNMARSDYVPKYSKIRPAVEYLQTHCTEPVKVADLAALCGYSEPHFFTLFQSLMHVSPLTYKNNLLMQRAMRELLETQDTIDAIAARLGFSSTNYFCRVFTKSVKRTPGEVRRSGERAPVEENHPCDDKKT
ncbi:MAG: helix-turn-helix transcriptional regulator [Clostridia bacterium]|nr:helix-turn-helix transcriptional regulator [Clostridia bacterium]